MFPKVIFLNVSQERFLFFQTKVRWPLVKFLHLIQIFLVAIFLRKMNHSIRNPGPIFARDMTSPTRIKTH